MKYIIIILILFSCTQHEQKQSVNKDEILYKVNIETQDSIASYIKDENSYFFIYNRDHTDGNHVFSLKRNPLPEIKSFVDRSNRFILIHKQKYKIISEGDYLLGKEKNERFSNVGGGTVFILDFHTRLIKVGHSM